MSLLLAFDVDDGYTTTDTESDISSVYSLDRLARVSDLRSNAQIEYRRLMTAWKHGERYNDVCDMLLEWITDYYSLIQSKRQIKHLLKRMIRDDPAEDIVIDFMFRKKYRAIHVEFTDTDTDTDTNAT